MSYEITKTGAMSTHQVHHIALEFAHVFNVIFLLIRLRLYQPISLHDENILSKRKKQRK